MQSVSQQITPSSAFDGVQTVNSPSQPGARSPSRQRSRGFDTGGRRVGATSSVLRRRAAGGCAAAHATRRPAARPMEDDRVRRIGVIKGTRYGLPHSPLRRRVPSLHNSEDMRWSAYRGQRDRLRINRLHALVAAEMTESCGEVNVGSLRRNRFKAESDLKMQVSTRNGAPQPCNLLPAADPSKRERRCPPCLQAIRAVPRRTPDWRRAPWTGQGMYRKAMRPWNRYTPDGASRSSVQTQGRIASKSTYRKAMRPLSRYLSGGAAKRK